MSNTVVNYRNAGDTADLLSLDDSGNLTVAGTVTSTGAAAFALADGKVMVGNGSGVAAAVSISGDATLSNTGALTIAAGAVEGAMLANADLGDVTVSSGTVTIDAGAVTAAKLATAVQDMVPYITVTGADLASAGTGTVTIQVKDAAANNLAGAFLIRTWIGNSDDYGVDAQTGFSVSTGTSKQAVTANGEHLVITDATGKIIMAVNHGGAGTVYAWAEIGGKIVASGALVLTAP